MCRWTCDELLGQQHPSSLLFLFLSVESPIDPLLHSVYLSLCDKLMFLMSKRMCEVTAYRAQQDRRRAGSPTRAGRANGGGCAEPTATTVSCGGGCAVVLPPPAAGGRRRAAGRTALLRDCSATAPLLAPTIALIPGGRVWQRLRACLVFDHSPNCGANAVEDTLGVQQPECGARSAGDAACRAPGRRGWGWGTGCVLATMKGKE